MYIGILIMYIGILIMYIGILTMHVHITLYMCKHCIVYKTLCCLSSQRKEEVRERRRLGSIGTHSSTPSGSHLDSQLLQAHLSRPDTPSSLMSK